MRSGSAVPAHLFMMSSAWIRAYQTSSRDMPANSAIALRYSMATVATISARCAGVKPLCRPATSKLATRRFTSHSNGPGSVSSKSLRSKTNVRSAVAKPPKFARCASPASCTVSPVLPWVPRSLAISAAAPR